jgi:catechol 2,3-dioxygenase-like lactoylglutathione lyase family enzyme
MATHDAESAIHPQTRIGHIHLTVADLHRSLAFYRDLLGFTVTIWAGDSAVFLSPINRQVIVPDRVSADSQERLPGNTRGASRKSHFL